MASGPQFLGPSYCVRARFPLLERSRHIVVRRGLLVRPRLSPPVTGLGPFAPPWGPRSTLEDMHTRSVPVARTQCDLAADAVERPLIPGRPSCYSVRRIVISYAPWETGSLSIILGRGKAPIRPGSGPDGGGGCHRPRVSRLVAMSRLYGVAIEKRASLNALSSTACPRRVCLCCLCCRLAHFSIVAVPEQPSTPMPTLAGCRSLSACHSLLALIPLPLRASLVEPSLVKPSPLVDKTSPS